MALSICNLPRIVATRVRWDIFAPALMPELVVRVASMALKFLEVINCLAKYALQASTALALPLEMPVQPASMAIKILKWKKEAARTVKKDTTAPVVLFDPLAKPVHMAT